MDVVAGRVSVRGFGSSSEEPKVVQIDFWDLHCTHGPPEQLRRTTPI